jgi:16S rRNA pseudouridine516 synthase
MKAPKPQTLQQILFSQGFGTRRECDAFIYQRRVTVNGVLSNDPNACFDLQGLPFTVNGEAWIAQEPALLMLNKPAGYECSMKPKHWPGVITLLPEPLRRRSKGGVQPVGRLDADTTGLLLMTDDGTLIHKLTSPKHKVPKVYEITTAESVTVEQVQMLAKGVKLDDEPTPIAAQACEQTGEKSLRLTLTEGKYHQVKRMVAAAGNHVEALHRSSIGNLVLPADLLPGQWRWVSTNQL